MHIRQTYKHTWIDRQTSEKTQHNVKQGVQGELKWKGGSPLPPPPLTKLKSYVHVALATEQLEREKLLHLRLNKTRDEDPTFFYTDPDPNPAQLEKYSGSDLKSK